MQRDHCLDGARGAERFLKRGGDIETGASGTGAIADTSLVPLVQRYVVSELLLLLVIPLAASLAARGIGTQLSAS